MNWRNEWWGNSITAYDYCDAWIHEGFATYSEALVIEKIYNGAYYDHFFWRYAAPFSYNKRPIKKPCGVRYNSWVHMADQDIYWKAALMLHTVRRQLDNDSLFFKALKETSLYFQKQNITTDQLITCFNTQIGKDFTPLFSLYLNYKEPPLLNVQFDAETRELKYRWANPLPEQVSLSVVARQDDSRYTFEPGNAVKTIKLNSKTTPEFNVGDFGYVVIQWVDPKDKKGI